MNPVTSKVMSNEKAKELLEANIKVCNHIYNFINSMSLKCAVQLGIFEAIHSHGKPMSIQDLSSALAINSQKARFLHQLMKFLAQGGYVREHELVYTFTPASEILLSNHPYSLRPYLLVVLDPSLVKPWSCLETWFRNEDSTAFSTANGMDLWQYARDEPRFSYEFNESMANSSRLLADISVRSREWAPLFDGLGSLVDVGGGTGEMARAVAEMYPHIKCSVLDLPHVVNGLQGAHNLTYVAGDMFEAIPSADAVLLRHILHDWTDEDSVKILKQCRKAVMSSGSGRRGKVMIIDTVLDNENTDSRARERQHFRSMEMMVLLGGKERNEVEWGKLFEDAGFTGGYKIHPELGLRSLIEVYP